MLEFSETRKDEWILKFCQWMEFARAGLPPLECSSGRLCPLLTLLKGSLARQAKGLRQYLGLRGFWGGEDQGKLVPHLNSVSAKILLDKGLNWPALMPTTIEILATYNHCWRTFLPLLSHEGSAHGANMVCLVRWQSVWWNIDLGTALLSHQWFPTPNFAYRKS